jgi:hypothetical protein
MAGSPDDGDDGPDLAAEAIAAIAHRDAQTRSRRLRLRLLAGLVLVEVVALVSGLPASIGQYLAIPPSLAIVVTLAVIAIAWGYVVRPVLRDGEDQPRSSDQPAAQSTANWRRYQRPLGRPATVAIAILVLAAIVLFGTMAWALLTCTSPC